MTPEQKQRIEQIEKRNKCGDYDLDIDFLLSLVKSQEAEIAKLTTQWCECGHAKDRHGFFSDHDECYECDQASPDLCCEWRPAPRPNENENAATSMRSACVEKVRERARHHFETARMINHGEAPDVPISSAQYIRLADELNTAANELESVSIQEQEAKQS